MAVSLDLESKIKELLSSVEVSKVEIEGPSICVYIRNPANLSPEEVAEVARTLKKRIIVRSDPSARLPKREAEKAILSLAGDLVESVEFEDVGDVYIYLSKAIPERDFKRLARDIFTSTGWRAIVEMGVPKMMKLPSKDVLDVRAIFHKAFERRMSMMRELGMRIHHEPIVREGAITISFLGASMEVGRSAILVDTTESKILLDCGLKPSQYEEEFPLLEQVDLDELDAVVLSHAHMDHVGCLPYLYKYGYKGPVYMTDPTKYLTYILLTDYVELKEREGLTPPYTKSDIEALMYHTITLDYEEVTDIAPDVKLTFYDAGHEIGSALIHLHIGNGRYNILYTGDFKFGRTNLLNRAVNKFKRVEMLIMESTYGGRDDVQPPRIEAENTLVKNITETIERGGKVLIPAFSTGRAQEILYILNREMNKGSLKKAPIYVDGMIVETLNAYLMYPHFLNREVAEEIYNGINPFTSSGNIQIIERAKRLEDRINQVAKIVQDGQPGVIIAPHGMLNGGPILEYFVHLAPDPANKLIFVSYQAENTLGRRILNGERDFIVRSLSMGEVKVSMKMGVLSIPGFSGHSDRRELMKYIETLEPRPKKIVLIHGEPSKTISLATSIEIRYKVTTVIPKVGERIRAL
ncbi:beta-CASP ribonuclease aCPSF1 [Thermoproteus tenax]|uniref:Transcription termination factor FttA n=1 Tax=Thermoproteus tenax (strain ATCC 35583 / DSM 2078 / JCM 9277 / NBRC 100435 / Kra 1) TaxID=768679 RepID=G4RLU2_THETK|nr:beta-CASP ribonuclease aCPSF1 [Thermoproteus tenax]CCC82537.1 mRNA 3'-end processing factor [Thermoproteus tenax Kra 1]